MIAVHGALAPLWGLTSAVAFHALVHAAHLIDGALTRRELRRRRPPAPVPVQPPRKEPSQ